MIKQMSPEIAKELREASRAIRKANDQKNVTRNLIRQNAKRYKDAKSLPKEKPYALDIIGGPSLNFAELMSHTEAIIFREDKEREALYWEMAKKLSLHQNLEDHKSLCQTLAKLLLNHLDLCYQHGENFNVYLPPLLEKIIEGKSITTVNRLKGY